jgi:hypothetical protein
MKFRDLCKLLATDKGGYTLWVGAGAARAVAGTDMDLPVWPELTEQLLKLAGGPTPPHWTALEAPDRLEIISDRLGHARFRQELRKRLLLPMIEHGLDWRTAVHQAMIGTRASAVVCFNIDRISGSLFVLGHGGNVAARTYLPKARSIAQIEVPMNTGLVTCPVYFPHGLLDEGNCVMTASEYQLHRMSLAANVAVSLCLGGDLLILGMSLGDMYLRDALIENRNWIREIYWVTNAAPSITWARAARVTVVEAEHPEIWPELATTIVGSNATLRERRDNLNEKLRPSVEKLQRGIAAFPVEFESWVTKHLPMLIGASNRGELAGIFEDLGLPVPRSVPGESR